MGFTAKELSKKNFPPPNWVVKDLLPEGVSILVGKPKMRKSFLALNIALAVPEGRAVLTLPTKKGDVLYISLEDNYRRLKLRLSKCCSGEIPDGLHFETEWPRMDEGGFEKLHEWITDHPKTTLIIIDTLVRIWPSGKKRGEGRTLYHQDYDFMTMLKKIADENGVAILGVHHMKKAEYDDPTDSPSGSAGIAGGADTLITLKRVRKAETAVLFVTGRDIEFERDDALEFDRATCTWQRIGRGDLLEQTPERSELLAILRASEDPMTTGDLSVATGKSVPNTSKLLRGLIEKGLVRRIKIGEYEAL